MVHVFLFFSTKIWIDGFHVKYLFSISSRSFVELRSMFDKQISTVSILSVHDFNMMLRSVNFAACALPPDSQKYRFSVFSHFLADDDNLSSISIHDPSITIL